MKQFSQLICIAFSLIASMTSMAQQPGKVSGKIATATGPLQKVSVSLFNSKDSSLEKMQLSANDGTFAFENIDNGGYYVEASLSGYKGISSPVFTVDGNVVLEPLHMSIQPKVLAGVTVQAKRPLLEMKADRMIVNVDASPSNAGSSALEVLEKSPGITVDKDGNISLKGKQGVMILLDGKPSYLDGAELANMLKGMSAAQLDQVEIMTNPPAKYDASGNAGVINIKTKKIKTKGFNGNVNTNYGQGVYAKAGLGTNLNYRKNKMNIFGSAGYNYRGGFQEFEVNRNLFVPNSGIVAHSFAQKGFMPETRNSFYGKAGIDYDFSKRTSGSVTLNLFDTKMTYDNKISSRIYDGAGILESSNNGRTYMTPHVTNYSANANLRHTFDTTGTELNFDASYIRFKDNHKQSFYNSFFDKDGTLTAIPDTLAGSLPSGYNVYAFKVDFSKPLNKKSTFESGLKGSYVSSDNNIRFDSIINGNKVIDVNRTNHYIYKESVYAGYINYNTSLSDKIKMQAGLRYEYTDGKGESKTNHVTFNNKYGDFFPTLYVSYDANQNNQFNINYGRRISRPQYKDMNPFVFIIDRYTFIQGNPYLQPQISQNIELSHLYRKTLTTTLNYSKTNGAISEVVETNTATKEATLIKKNIATKEQYGIALNFYKPVNKWLTVIANANGFNNRYKGIVNDSAIDFKATTGNFYAALQFKFTKGWDAEVNGFYNTRGVDGVSFDGAMGMFSVAGSKSVLDNKGKISLNVRDPFQLLKFNSRSKFGAVDAQIISHWDNRAVTLTFNYRFGKQFKTNKRTEGSATEEQGRIGG